MNDPIEFRIHDYELTLRNEDASCIEIELINDSFEEKEKVFRYSLRRFMVSLLSILTMPPRLRGLRL